MKPHVICRWLALAAALALTACASGSLPPTHAIVAKAGPNTTAIPPQPETAPGPVEAMTPPPDSGPAMLRFAGVADVVGAWGVVPLPAGVNPSSYVSGQFSEPYQYYQILADGRFGTVRRFDAPVAPMTDLDVQTALAMAPAYDTYTLGNGIMVVRPYTVTGITFQGQQAWAVQSVASGGTILGTYALPGDLLMTLQNQTDRQPYYRLLRRLPPAIYPQ